MQKKFIAVFCMLICAFILAGNATLAETVVDPSVPSSSESQTEPTASSSTTVPTIPSTTPPTVPTTAPTTPSTATTKKTTKKTTTKKKTTKKKTTTTTTTTIPPTTVKKPSNKITLKKAYEQYSKTVIKYKVSKNKTIKIDFKVYKKWLRPNYVKGSKTYVKRKQPFYLRPTRIKKYCVDLMDKMDVDGYSIYKGHSTKPVMMSKTEQMVLNYNTVYSDAKKRILGKKSVTKKLPKVKSVKTNGRTIGNSYIEINLEKQRIWFYKKGKLVDSSSIISGNVSKKTETRKGVFAIFSKETKRTLSGEDYEVFVDYWMPFDGGIGLHDAKWRYNFGGSIYKTNGSHGCVNLPSYMAKKIFENVSVGYTVVVY